MTDALMDLSPGGSGRVPLKLFHSRPNDDDLHFTESAEYLREIGALEESTFGRQSVLIANYVSGPSNCIASSAYYSVCCINECEGLMNELELMVNGPTAESSLLLRLVANLSSPTVDAPRELPADLSKRLLSIADQHSGQVHLHGRLFAQWLHYAFPNDCPYPHLAENASVLTPGHWENGKHLVSDEEKWNFEQAVFVGETMAEHFVASRWSDEEILPVAEMQYTYRNSFHSILRLLMMVALCMGVFRVAFNGCHSVRHASNGHEDKASVSHFV